MEMKVSKVFLYILKFADKSIIRMLSVNRKFSNDTYFERITKRNILILSVVNRITYYLVLAFYKKQNTWKYFFFTLSYNII